jgi:2-polyprenyl-3-methyl-5-hydroxy-6-metoxy-1,4-benzoquinol methylase
MSLTDKGYWKRYYQPNLQPRHAMVDPNRYYFDSECMDFITPYLPVVTPQNPVRLLEMGCGNSLWLPFFASTWNYQVNGIDYSEDGCKLAQANLAAKGCSGNVQCLDFTRLGDEFQGIFDVVFSLGVVEHFENTSELVGYFVRCLKPGGVIITVVPNMVGIMGKIQKLVSERIYKAHQSLDLSALVKVHTDQALSIQASGYLMFLGLGMIDFPDLPFKRWFGKTIYGLDLLHLFIRRLTGLMPQSSSCSSFVAVIACRGEA